MKKGVPPWSMVSAVAEQVLTALEAAHQAGVIHGALTPQHIFLAREPGGRERCKLHGFGVSRIWHLYPHPSFAEERIEAAFYLSPEHAQGKTGELGPASDCFSFASILFELVTGKQPFSAASAGAIIYKIGHGQADSVLQHRPDAPPAPRQGPFARLGARPRTSPDCPRAPRRIACSALERPVPRRRLRRNSGAVRSRDRAKHAAVAGAPTRRRPQRRDTPIHSARAMVAGCSPSASLVLARSRRQRGVAAPLDRVDCAQRSSSSSACSCTSLGRTACGGATGRPASRAGSRASNARRGRRRRAEEAPKAPPPFIAEQDLDHDAQEQGHAQVHVEESDEVTWPRNLCHRSSPPSCQATSRNCGQRSTRARRLTQSMANDERDCSTVALHRTYPTRKSGRRCTSRRVSTTSSWQSYCCDAARPLMRSTASATRLWRVPPSSRAAAAR